MKKAYRTEAALEVGTHSWHTFWLQVKAQKRPVFKAEMQAEGIRATPIPIIDGRKNGMVEFHLTTEGME